MFTTREYSELYSKLKYLMILRVVVISTFLLGALMLIDWRTEEPSIFILIGLIIFLYLLTIVYSLLLNRIHNLRAFAYVQIIGDILFETGLIAISGGIFSPLSFLYILSILTGGILLMTYGAYLMAAISCVAYGTMAALVHNEILPNYAIYGYNQLAYSTNETLYKLFVNFCAFFLVAYLSNYLISGLERVGEELDTKEEDLSRLQKLNDNILRSIDSGLMTVDLAGRIISFNLAAERITGYSRDQVLHREATQLFPIGGILPAGDVKHVEKTLRFEGQFVTPDGRELYLGYSRSTLFDEMKVRSGFIIIFQDLTELKRLEAAKRRADQMALLGELAARMAHEIRNPLTSMKGSIEVISKERGLSDSGKRLMDIVLRESDRLNRLITEFLQYAHPKKLLSQSFSLTDVVKETVILLRNHPRKSDGVRIEQQIPTEDIMVYGDMFQIKQVIFNLCLNALDAMYDDGEGVMSIILNACMEPSMVTRLANEGERAFDPECLSVLSISDTGVGVKPELRDQIFTPFFSTKDEGTGLGLAIAYRIVEEHGGFIDFDSQPGKGTTFQVALPLVRDDDTGNISQDGQNEQSANR